MDDDLERCERIVAIANRCRRASPGWTEVAVADVAGVAWTLAVRRDGRSSDARQAERDADFLREARSDIEWLLDEIERLKEEAEDDR